MAASPFTRTSKQPLRGFSSLILMGTPGAPAFSRASSLVARVLNAPQDLQASIAISAAAVLVDDGAFAAGALAGFFAGAFFSIVFFGAIGASRSRRRQKKSRRVRLLLFSTSQPCFSQTYPSALACNNSTHCDTSCGRNDRCLAGSIVDGRPARSLVEIFDVAQRRTRLAEPKHQQPPLGGVHLRHNARTQPQTPAALVLFEDCLKFNAS